MVILDEDIVGRVETDPAEALAAPQGYPGMGGVGALQARLARRRDGAQIAADIGRGQAEAAQPGDHHMGEILTNPVTFFEYLVERGRDDGCLRIVLKIAADPVHQIDRAGKDAAPVHEDGHLKGVAVLEGKRFACQFGGAVERDRGGGCE